MLRTWDRDGWSWGSSWLWWSYGASWLRLVGGDVGARAVGDGNGLRFGGLNSYKGGRLISAW